MPVDADRPPPRRVRRPRRWSAPRSLVPLLGALLLAACGSGGDPSPEPDPEPSRPDVALLLVSGHAPATPDYLATSTGITLRNAIANEGWTVEVASFVDAATSTAPAGYLELVETLQTIRDAWIVDQADPTRIVLVAHSHGCVRAHAAIRAVPDCPIHLLVDLDGSSLGWDLLHGEEDALLGGAPEGAYDLGVVVECPAFPEVGSAPGPFDLEDVVFDSVVEALEVRSGDRILDPDDLRSLVEYDERWNARPDGTTEGLVCHFSDTNHGEVYVPTGATYLLVSAWIRERLAAGD